MKIITRKKNYYFSNETIKVGDIFVASWGYEQTNIDFYEVQELVGKATIVVAPIENKIVQEHSNQTQDAVLPYPAAKGESFRAKVKWWNMDWADNVPRFRINSYANAYKWDGKVQYQTNPYYGH